MSHIQMVRRLLVLALLLCVLSCLNACSGSDESTNLDGDADADPSEIDDSEPLDETEDSPEADPATEEEIEPLSEEDTETSLESGDVLEEAIEEPEEDLAEEEAENETEIPEESDSGENEESELRVLDLLFPDGDGENEEIETQEGFTQCGEEKAVFFERGFSDLLLNGSTLLVVSDQGEIAVLEPDKADSTPVWTDFNALKLYQPHPAVLAILTRDGALRTYDASSFGPSSVFLAEAPLAAVHFCQNGQNIFWVSMDLESFEVYLNAGRISDDGQIVLGDAAGPLTHSPTGLSCSSNGAVGLSSDVSSYMMNGFSVAYRYSVFDAHDSSSIGSEQILFEGNGGGMTGAGGSTRHFMNGTRLLLDGDYYWNDQPPMIPGTTVAYNALYDLSDPANVVKSNDIEINLTDWRAWTEEKVFTVRNRTVTRSDFSSLQTLTPQSSFEARGNVNAFRAQGDHTLLAADDYGVQIVTMPASGEAALVGERRLVLPFGQTTALFHDHGNTWAVINGSFLYVLDAEHPDSIEPVAFYDAEIGVQQVIVEDQRWILIGYDSDWLALEIVDTTDPLHPSRVFAGNVARPLGLSRGYSGRSILDGNRLIVSQTSLSAIDLSVPTAPVALWEISSDDILDHPPYPDFQMVNKVGDMLVVRVGVELYGLRDLGTAAPEAVYRIQPVFYEVYWHGSIALGLTPDEEEGTRLTKMDFGDPMNPTVLDSVVRTDIYGYYDTTRGVIEGRFYWTHAQRTHLLDLTEPNADLRQDAYAFDLGREESATAVFLEDAEEPTFWVGFRSDYSVHPGYPCLYLMKGVACGSGR